MSQLNPLLVRMVMIGTRLTKRISFLMLSKRNQKEDVEGLVPEDAEAAVHPEPEPIDEEAVVEELLPK